jgi:hypothetical protein
MSQDAINQHNVESWTTVQCHANTPDAEQERQEQLRQLADIFACIFAGLTPEQRANYMSMNVRQVAA